MVVGQLIVKAMQKLVRSPPLCLAASLAKDSLRL